MVFICCVPECPYKKPKFKLTVHNFPRDKTTAARWIMAIGRPDLIDKKLVNYRICNAHFHDDDKIFGPTKRTSLKSNAFPTLYLPNKSKEKDAHPSKPPNMKDEGCTWSEIERQGQEWLKNATKLMMTRAAAEAESRGETSCLKDDLRTDIAIKREPGCDPDRPNEQEQDPSLKLETQESLNSQDDNTGNLIKKDLLGDVHTDDLLKPNTSLLRTDLQSEPSTSHLSKRKHSNDQILKKDPLSETSSVDVRDVNNKKDLVADQLVKADLQNNFNSNALFRPEFRGDNLFRPHPRYDFNTGHYFQPGIRDNHNPLGHILDLRGTDVNTGHLLKQPDPRVDMNQRDNIAAGHLLDLRGDINTGHLLKRELLGDLSTAHMLKVEPQIDVHSSHLPKQQDYRDNIAAGHLLDLRGDINTGNLLKRELLGDVNTSQMLKTECDANGLLLKQDHRDSVAAGHLLDLRGDINTGHLLKKDLLGDVNSGQFVKSNNRLDASNNYLPKPGTLDDLVRP